MNLSEREIVIVRLIADGKGTKEIAESLLITNDEATYNLGVIIDKFEIEGNRELVISTQSFLQNELSLLKTVAAIPCFNEERYIYNIVNEARKYTDQVIVVDDGSTDNTCQIAIEAGALVLRHKKNSGAGAATRSCFKLARVCNAHILITMDGDNQHAPEDIPALIRPILNGEADLVIGSRFIKPDQNINMPRYRKLGINAITSLFNICSKMNVSDTQSCFRAYSRKALESINITESGFGFSIEILKQANEEGLTFHEVPISCLYHDDGSTLNPVMHGLSVTLTTMKLYLNNVKNKIKNSVIC